MVLKPCELAVWTILYVQNYEYLIWYFPGRILTWLSENLVLRHVFDFRKREIQITELHIT
jgi:hypothetical protein